MVTNAAKLQEKIKALTNIDGSGGIDILTDSGEFKSTYDILLAISKVWKDMDDTSQAALLELVAGKTRGSVVAALFQNGDVLEDAYESATGASGSAMRELNTYLDSISGKMELFTNSVQTMWMNLIDSEVIKFFVDLGTTLINLADKIGVIKIAFAGMTTMFMRKNGINSLDEFFKAGAISAEEATKKLAELQAEYNKLDGSKNQKNLRKQDKIAQQMKPYEAIAKGAEKAKVANENLAKAQEQLTNAQAKLTHAQENGFPTETIRSYQVLVDDAKLKVEQATQEVQKCEIANKNLGNSAAIGWNKLKAGAAALGKQLASIAQQMLEMYAITAVLDVLGWIGEGIVNAFDEAYETVDEAQEKLDELKNELDAIESEISSLNSELDNTNEAIEDLMDKGTLSFTEQEELNRLKAVSAELEKQIAFQETLKETKSKAVNAQAVHATNKYLNETSFDSDKSRTERQEKSAEDWSKILGIVGLVAGLAAIPFTGGASSPLVAAGLTSMGLGGAGYLIGSAGGNAFGSWIGGNSYDSEQNVADAIENMKATRAKFEADIQKAINDGDAAAYNEATEALNNYDAKMADHMSTIAQNANSFDWSTATENEKKQMQETLNLIDAYNIAMGSKDASKNALDRLFGEDAEDVVKAYKNKIKSDIENGKAVDFQEMIDVTGLGDDLDALGLTTKDVADYFTKLGEAGADAVEKIDFSGVISELAEIEGALGSVKSVMEEFQEEGIVSASTLAGLDEGIQKLDSFAAYAETLMSGNASKADVQAATEDLVKEFLDDNVDNIKGNKLTYISQLENMGVGNASDLIDSYINNSFWNSSEFDNFTGGYRKLIEVAQEYGVVLDENTAKEIEAAKIAVAGAQSKYEEAQIAKAEAERRNNQKQEIANALRTDPKYTSFKYLFENIEQLHNRTGFAANYSDDNIKRALETYTTMLEGNLSKYGYTLEDAFPELEIVPSITSSEAEVNKYKKALQELLDKMGISVTPEINFNDNSALEETARVEEAFAKLGEAYEEFKEHGIVDATSLVELQEAFGDINGFEDFVNILGDSESKIEDVEKAIQGLANEFLNTFDYSTLFNDEGELIDAEARRVAAQLENIGVENANELVRQKAWAYNKANEIYGIDLSNYATAEDAKNGYLVQSVINQIETTGKGMIDGFAEQYKKDLQNYGTSWEQKIKCAKESAKKVLAINEEAERSSLEAEFEERMANSQGGIEAQMNEQWFMREEKKIAEKYREAKASIDAINEIPTIDESVISAWDGGTTITPDKMGGNSDGSNSTTEIDWLDHYFADIETQIKEKEADLENAMSADVGGLKNKNTIIDDIIGLYNDKKTPLQNAINEYSTRAGDLLDGFSQDIKDKIADGSLDLEKDRYDDETIQQIQDYFDYIAKASDLQIELNGVKVTIADLSLQKFDNVADAFDNEIEEKFQSDQDLIEAEIGYLEEQGKRVSPELYQKLIDIQKDEQEVLEEKKKTLEDTLAEEVRLGRIKVGSEQWYKMKAAINDVDEELIKSRQDVEKFQNSINDIDWDNLDKLVCQIDAVDSELSHLFDLLSDDDKVVDEFGNWTDEGIASLGLLAMQMENAQAKADEYAQKIRQLDEDYANGKYSLDEYNEKSAELKDSYLSEIKNIEDLKDEMVSLNKVRIDAIKNGIDKEIEALEEKNEKIKESLDLEKEQYEWQKQVAEKEKSIADIQRRLNALAGDNSASAIAERRKLQAELAQAQAEMDDMWYEHSIEEQKKGLDESLDNYKENKEDEKEALDKWLEDEEKVIQESFDLFNSNLDIVDTVLKNFEEEHGIKLSEAITDPWHSGINAMEAYRQKLAEMKQEQEDAKNNANDAADDIINSFDNPQPESPSGGTTPSQGTSGDTTSSHKEYTVKKNDTLYDIAKSELGSASRWPEIYNLNKDTISDPNLIYPGQKIKLPYYAKGTTGVKDDQWAITDELGPELTLHAGPNGRLQYLTKGSGVVTADLTKRLMEWGELDPSQVLSNSAPKIGAPHITTNNMEINLQIAEVVHIDHADSNSIQDITSAVRKQMDQYMKNVNQSLKRFAR